uniref:Phosphate-binding protein n=1 Tax=Eiseniibacteriota bacterium TaxID=2212470 RepID=A0A832I6U3_UNCEI
MRGGRFILYAAGLAAALALSHWGCAQRERALTIKGSDTMVILGQRWAETYMKEHPGALVQVTGGGSGTGIAALINGTTDICQSSRPLKDDEKRQLTEKFGGPGHETIVAMDGIALYAHQDNPVSEMTLDQVKAVYTGAITNWKDLGGPDAPVVVYSRENNSGTYEYFKDHVLGGADFAAGVQTLPGTAAVVNAVAQEPRALGYGGAAYAKGVKEIAIRRDASSPAVLPSLETVRSGEYPIARNLFYYTRRAPEGAAKAFIDWALSEAGQAIVTEVGYYPVR